jgi:RNA polymerase sigma-70 factor (ECF subfamily)
MKRSGGSARTRQFEELMLPFAGSIYRTAYHLAGAQEAEDLTQETFLKAYQSFEQFRGPDPKPWLFAILRHTYFDQCRRRRRELPVIAFDDYGLPQERCVPCVPSAEEQVLSGRLDGNVQVALSSLPDEWKLVVLLADVEDLSYREIADVMQIPIGTVMSRLSRARKRLYTLLGEHAGHIGYAVEHAS